MTSVMRARNPADLIALVPVLLGFHPRESLVAITVHQPRHRLGFRLRIDLPSPQDADDAAAHVVSYLTAQQPDSVLLVAVSKDAAGADPVVDAVRRHLGEAGIGVDDAIRCDGARYWSYLCDDPACCPSEGTPYETDSNALLAEAVYRGVEVLPDREALVERFAAVGGRTRQEMFAATERVADRLDAVSGLGPRDRDAHVLRTGIDVVTPIVDRFQRDPACRLSDDEAAALSVWGSLIVVRDVLWARMTRDNADTHLAMWRQVAARVVPPYEPAVLSLTAFAAWLSGSGLQAQCALDRVAEADPSYSMANLVQTALRGGLSPQTWEGLDEGEVMRSVPGLA